MERVFRKAPESMQQKHADLGTVYAQMNDCFPKLIGTQEYLDGGVFVGPKLGLYSNKLFPLSVVRRLAGDQVALSFKVEEESTTSKVEYRVVNGGAQRLSVNENGKQWEDCGVDRLKEAWQRKQEEINKYLANYRKALLN